jgi:predicted site-specific integrase-resolvase
MENVTAVVVKMLPDGRMRAEEAAKYVGLSSKTLAQWRCQGKGPRSVKRGGRVFYRLDDLKQWIADGK